MKKKKTTKNYDWMTYGSWEMVHGGWTDGQTDERKKWHIEVGAHLKTYNPCFQKIYIYIYFLKLKNPQIQQLVKFMISSM